MAQPGIYHAHDADVFYELCAEIYADVYGHGREGEEVFAIIQPSRYAIRQLSTEMASGLATRDCATHPRYADTPQRYLRSEANMPRERPDYAEPRVRQVGVTSVKRSPHCHHGARRCSPPYRAPRLTEYRRLSR